MTTELAVQYQGALSVSANNLNTYGQTCDNVDDLRGFIGITGVQVYMRGYVSPNDGGQGNFYWNAAGTDPDDNGVTTIVPNGVSEGCWTRLSGGGSGSGSVTSITAGAGLAGGTITTSGTISLANIAPYTVMANTTGIAAVPSSNTPSAVLDIISSTQGSILYRNATEWVALSPGTSGQVLQTLGAAANPAWATVAGTGTVTSVGTGTGLTGGPITTSGTVSLASIASNRILANITAGSAAPIANSLSDILDATVSSTQGVLLYRGASGWVPLGTGTSGQFLKTQGSAADPVWASVSPGTGSETTVASANDLVLPVGYNLFWVTGTTTINTISATGWTVGSTITLQFASTACTLTNNGSGTGAVILMDDGFDFSSIANDMMIFQLDHNTQWKEVRHVNRRKPRLDKLAINFAVQPTNLMFLRADTATESGYATAMQFQGFRRANEGFTNPKLARFYGNITASPTTETYFVLSAELDVTTNSSADGHSAFSAVSQKIKGFTGAAFAGHFQVKDFNEYAAPTDVTAEVGYECNIQAWGPDHPTANDSTGLRRCADIIARNLIGITGAPDCEVGVGVLIRADSLSDGYFRYGLRIQDGTANPNPITTGMMIKTEGTYAIRTRGSHSASQLLMEGAPNNTIQLATTGNYGIHGTGTHALIDIYLEGDTPNGIIVGGTRSGSGVRLNDGIKLGLSTDNARQMLYDSGTTSILMTSSGTTRHSFNMSSTPSYSVGGVLALTTTKLGQILGTFNVKDAAYGAVGNGVTDDATAIQAAVTAAVNAGGGIVYFPASTGSYVVGTEILVNGQGVIFMGEGNTRSRIQANANGIGTVKFGSLSTSSSGKSADCAIYNMGFTCTASSSVPNVTVYGTTRFGAYKCDFYRGTKALQIQNSDQFDIVDCSERVTGSTAIACYLLQGTSDDVTTGRITGGLMDITGTGGSQGLWFGDASGGSPNEFNNIYIGQLKIDGNNAASTDGIRIEAGLRNVIFENVEIKECRGYSINGVTSLISGQKVFFDLHDCKLLGNSGNPATAHLYLQGSSTKVSVFGMGTQFHRATDLIRIAANTPILKLDGIDGNSATNFLEITAGATPVFIMGYNSMSSVTNNYGTNLSGGNATWESMGGSAQASAPLIESGTATIDNGTTSEAVTFPTPFPEAPPASAFSINFTEDPTNTPGAWWVSSITTTGFTLNVENDPGDSNLDFSWKVVF